MEKLTEDELSQLKTLLIRYLAYHAEGFFNKAVDALLAKFRTSASMIDVTPTPELPAPELSAKRKKGSPDAMKGGVS